MWDSRRDKFRDLDESTSVLNMTLSQLVMYKLYLGYEMTSWDFRIRSFVVGLKNRTYIYNLNYTFTLLRYALSIFFQIALRRGYCAIINENEFFWDRLENSFRFFFDEFYSKKTRLFLTFQRLKRGTFTNNRLSYFRKPLFRLLPELCVFTSSTESEYIINECQRIGIPSICIIESNLLPVKATYVIPSNEKSYGAVKLYSVLFFLMAAKAHLLRAHHWVEFLRQRFLGRIYRGFRGYPRAELPQLLDAKPYFSEFFPKLKGNLFWSRRTQCYIRWARVKGKKFTWFRRWGHWFSANRILAGFKYKLPPGVKRGVPKTHPKLTRNQNYK